MAKTSVVDETNHNNAYYVLMCDCINYHNEYNRIVLGIYDAEHLKEAIAFYEERYCKVKIYRSYNIWYDDEPYELNEII